jgi:hypothetical protein
VAVQIFRGHGNKLVGVDNRVVDKRGALGYGMVFACQPVMQPLLMLSILCYCVELPRRPQDDRSYSVGLQNLSTTAPLVQSHGALVGSL